MPAPSAAPTPELTVSVRRLSRQPGTSQRLRIDFEAPEGLGTAVIGVRRGEPIKLDLLLESVLEGVLATGTVRAAAEGECGRCLGEVGWPVETTFQDLFEYPERALAADQAGQGGAGDRLTVVDEAIDLSGSVRDAVVLSLPFSPLCREDCEGLCPECGARLADEPGHAHRSVGARWAALAAWDAGEAGEAGSNRTAGRLEDLLEDEREEI